MATQTNSDRPFKDKLIATLRALSSLFYTQIILRPVKSGLIYFFFGLFAALVLGWVFFPMALYSRHSQPVNFSHVVHLRADNGIEGANEQERCLFCHEFQEDGTFSGIPKIAKCTQCHENPESPLGKNPEEAVFLKEYVAKNQEVPWLVYSRQPDCVFFSHIAHVKMGKMDCRTCHGDHAKTDKLPVFQKNRISGYSINIWGKNISGYKKNTWDRMKMDDCARCHTQQGRKESNACFVCHK
jgi:hypothetical protein